MVGHSLKNKKPKAKKPKQNVLTAACGQSPQNKKSKAAQTNKDILINIPRQNLQESALDNTLK